MPTLFSPSSAIEIDSYKTEFLQTGKTHIPQILELKDAKTLLTDIVDFPIWNLCTRLKGQHIDMDAAVTDKWPEEKMRELLHLVHEAAQSGFQYIYKNVPAYDLHHCGGHELCDRIYDSLNQPVFLELFRNLTDEPDIGFADCQITCFEPGHFLTVHDDMVEGKNRVAAFVLNLTPDWRSDWGGALHFYDEQGHSTQALIPKFNALNLFKVGQDHAVGYVTPFATQKRYAITGWLRKGKDPLGQK